MQTTDWSLYWPDWLVPWAQELGALTRVYGGWNQNSGPLRHVRKGDRLFLISGFQGRIHLLGGLQVAALLPVDTADRHRPHSAASHVATGSPLGDFRIDRVVPNTWLRSWQFRNADGSVRAVSHLEGDQLKKTNAFRGCYRLEPDTGDRLLQLLQPLPEGELLSDDQTLRELELQRMAHPADRELALVHLDALLERGDARAEVLELELKQQGQKTQRALKSFLRRAEQPIVARPGGFPFRMSWALPKRLRP